MSLYAGMNWGWLICVGRSGLRGSEWVKWFKGKTSFPCIIDILQKEAALFFLLF